MTHQSRSAEIAATVADPAPVLQLIVVSAVEILQGAAGVIALLEGDRLVPRASYGLPAGALAGLHPRLDRAILNVLGQLGEQVSVLYLPSGFGDWARRYHVLALPMQQQQQLLGVIYVFRYVDAGGFSDRDLHVLDVFARQAAGALQQGRATADMLAEKTRLEEMQSTFVSIVSHELQTPVAIIKSYAATLAREDATWSAETIQRVSRNIEEECDRLHRLITDLLDLSRIQAGRVAMRVGSVDLPQIAAEVVDQLSPRSPRHSLRVSFARDFPLVRGDADQLRRALFNLVQNAVKYSPDGGEVLVAGEVPSGSAVLVRVIDHGVGIAPGEEERIFERFHRTDNRLSRTTAGVGLGLYITRNIVEGHGGRIWAESAGPGRGSTFNLLLPTGVEAREP
ncbi:MAG: GAF domain-containing protein [Chloroflexi bacterium]|nr:GAF domain-containing protein [Chloroflexota bacterium]MBV9134249.1 GAF domain-containing protein [Chloroflexota bacterium]